MTRLTKPVRREIPAADRPIIVELRSEGLYLREKGRRIWYGPLSYGHLMLDGARLYIEARKREKLGRSARTRSQQARARRRARGF